MSDSVSMSLDDYIKSNKKLGRMNNNRGRGGSKSGLRQRGGGGRNNVSFNRGGRNNTSFNRGGNRSNQNSFQGRKRQALNNVQRQRGVNRGRGAQSYSRVGSNNFRGNAPQYRGQGQIRGQRLGFKNRQPKRQRNANANIFNQVLSQPQQGSSKQFYSGNVSFSPKINRQNLSNRPKRISIKKFTGGSIQPLMATRNVKARTKSVLKLAKKRVQRAKMVVSRNNTTRGLGTATTLITNTGRVALGNNGFVTVRNNKSKQMEKALVKMKIARARAARNNLPIPQRQRQVKLAVAGGSATRYVTRAPPSPQLPSLMAFDPMPKNWSTPIVRTMRNDLADEMGNGQLNPEIQRKIAFIQNRSTRDRAPVMADFKAPVTTSRMKLSDRFRLLRDQ